MKCRVEGGFIATGTDHYYNLAQRPAQGLLCLSAGLNVFQQHLRSSFFTQLKYWEMPDKSYEG